MIGLYPGDGALLSGGGALDWASAPLLRAYWHGDDISGSNWPTRAGSQSTTASGGGTSGAWSGSGHNALLTARKQENTKVWDVSGTGSICYLFVGKMNFGGSYIGPASAYTSVSGGGKSFPLACDSGDHSVRTSCDGSTLLNMFPSKAAWDGLPFACVINHRTTGAEMWIRIDGAVHYATVSNTLIVAPVGYSLGGWADSGGDWNEPLGGAAILGGAVSDSVARALLAGAQAEFLIP